MTAAHEPTVVPKGLEGDDRYRLRDPREVVRVLQTLVDARALITAQLLPGGLSCPTALLEVDPAAGTVLLDGNRQEAVNARMAAARQVVCAAQLDGVRVEFRLQGLRRAAGGGAVAFTAPLPGWVLRLQRREMYRLPLLPGPTVTLAVPEDPEDEDPVRFRVLDISGGGLALRVEEVDAWRFRPGAALQGCTLHLPEEAIPELRVEVRHLSRLDPPLAGATLRAGCRFLDLPGPVEKRLLRFIFQVERQRNARERGVA